MQLPVAVGHDSVNAQRPDGRGHRVAVQNLEDAEVDLPKMQSDLNDLTAGKPKTTALGGIVQSAVQEMNLIVSSKLKLDIDPAFRF